ncbi:hypothetical protein [Larkinella sp. C7]|uniref:hypothetical protein n=1 Tax=Larkinella sp. C7 TaxID=2576607 RepID=UPI00111101D9|nr:hypothetical protein [Larkinella sp. C7]
MTEKSSQILAFPFSKRHWDDCNNPREAVFQLKLEAAKMLNDVAEGRYIMSEGNINGMHKINALCVEMGLTPLDF